MNTFGAGRPPVWRPLTSSLSQIAQRHLDVALLAQHLFPDLGHAVGASFQVRLQVGTVRRHVRLVAEEPETERIGCGRCRRCVRRFRLLQHVRGHFVAQLFGDRFLFQEIVEHFQRDLFQTDVVRIRGGPLLGGRRIHVSHAHAERWIWSVLRERFGTYQILVGTGRDRLMWMADQRRDQLVRIEQRVVECVAVAGSGQRVRLRFGQLRQARPQLSVLGGDHGQPIGGLLTRLGQLLHLQLQIVDELLALAIGQLATASGWRRGNRSDVGRRNGTLTQGEILLLDAGEALLQR